MEMSRKEQKNPYLNKGIALQVLITLFSFMLFVIAVFWFFPLPEILSYFGYGKVSELYAVVDVGKIDNFTTSYMIGQLAKNGTVMSLDDLWEFQSSFYQTFITFLIAINGLIAAFSVIYIKSTSEEKVEEISKRHFDGELFKYKLEEKVASYASEKFGQTQEELNNSLGEVDKIFERLQRIENEFDAIRQQIKHTSNRVAMLDSSEMDGGELLLSKGDD